jgi:hypothetical protein
VVGSESSFLHTIYNSSLTTIVNSFINCGLRKCHPNEIKSKCRTITCVVMTIPEANKTKHIDKVVMKRTHLLSPSLGNSSTKPVTTVSMHTIYNRYQVSPLLATELYIPSSARWSCTSLFSSKTWTNYGIIAKWIALSFTDSIFTPKTHQILHSYGSY